MKIGPIVGTRTWGGVAGMDYADTLIDGTALALPVVGIFFSQGGYLLENRGVTPDIIVNISPQVWTSWDGRFPHQI
jgi:tricorn protease